MDTADRAAILSFSAPRAESAPVEVTVSPVLELAYAFYFLAQHPQSAKRRQDLSWLEDIYERDAELPEAVSTIWPDEPSRAGLELFVLICELGYARDSGPERLLADLPGLPARLRDTLEAPAEEDEGEHQVRQLVRSRFRDLEAPEKLERYRSLLRRLWNLLEPFWQSKGKLAAEQARRALVARLEESGDILAALPAHHFAQFEAGAEKLRAAQQAGQLVVVPLSVAAGGGFNFDVQNVHYLGFGVQSEQHFEKLRARAEQGANDLKPLADPTRLLLLILIGRHQGFALTVGDLAKQLGVSQPTVSGHLKLLREAGLVLPEKQGTRTFYRLQAEQVEAVLSAAAELLSFNRK